MRFSKYHGLGNDFVMVADPGDDIRLAPTDVRRLCDRRFGVGADGVIRVAPGRDGTDLVMDYVNSDGSVGEMCGNGIRCLALFARAEGLTEASELRVGTRAGVRLVRVLADGRVEVDMGPPAFAPAEIPVAWEGTDALGVKLETAGGVIEVACVSMGNPHAVLFDDDPSVARARSLGPAIETHPLFPRKTNVELVRVERRDRLTMAVWERGSGATLACGTGACAAAVVARLLAGTGENVTVALPGGELEVRWRGSLEQPEHVMMTGPARETFRGEVSLEDA
jgi:diaminopimelate epimerase